MSHDTELYAALIGIAVVGLLSVVIRMRGAVRSSWPTWLFVPIAVWFALPIGGYSKPPDPLQPFCAVLFALVILRWAFAVLRRERSRSWILYLGILVTIMVVTMFWWPNKSLHPTAARAGISHFWISHPVIVSARLRRLWLSFCRWATHA